MLTICLMEGDGVGQEVISPAAQVLQRLVPDARFVHADAGWECFVRTGSALPEESLLAAESADAVLFGATQSPMGAVAGYRSPILELRRRLDLYANLRPSQGVAAGGRPFDLLIVRENTEGLYSGRERREGDLAVAERWITRRASERIARVAFEAARSRGAARSLSGGSSDRRPQVAVVHKANVLKISDGLFRECCLGVAQDYPDVETIEVLVDAAAMRLARDPGRFDVLVTTNMFGDILSDLVAGLGGGLGMAPSANVGDSRPGVFEPVHGSAPDIAKLGVANPCGAILSAGLLLDHLGLVGEAERLRRAVSSALASGIRPRDLGGDASTKQVAASILANLP